MTGTEPHNQSRFEFGKNWLSFLDVLDDDRINEAKKSVCEFMSIDELHGKSFLDIGSGSGLFSLAARLLGATVHSFDYDEHSVASTTELKKRYFPDDPHWKVEQASILDQEYTNKIGQFDICYAWGSLHHTGSLWEALTNTHTMVADDGFVFIGIYNDQGIISSFWKLIKKTYCSGPLAKIAVAGIFYPSFFLGGLIADLLQLKNPVHRYKEHKKHRGMSLVHDWRDWLGGFPYEVATPEKIISFFEDKNYTLRSFQAPKHGFGNNQFLFQKTNTANEALEK